MCVFVERVKVCVGVFKEEVKVCVCVCVCVCLRRV